MSHGNLEIGIPKKPLPVGQVKAKIYWPDRKIH